VAEHVLQGELPPSGVEVPSVLFEEQAKEEKILLAPLSQWGQEASSFDWLEGRSNSNLTLH